MITKNTYRFRSRPFRAATGAALLLAALSVAPSSRGAEVHFGNFAPGTPIDFSGGGDDIWDGLNGSQYAAVSFTTGAQAIQITTVDLALGGSASGDGLFLAVTTADFPATGPVLLTLDTAQTIPTGSAERISFTANAAVTLAANTTFYLQLQWDSDEPGEANWFKAINLTPILSDYSDYSLTYGSVGFDPDVDGGAYYITATVVPEPGETGIVIGGALLAGLGVRAWRRRSKTNGPRAVSARSGGSILSAIKL